MLYNVGWYDTVGDPIRFVAELTDEEASELLERLRRRAAKDKDFIPIESPWVVMQTPYTLERLEHEIENWLDEFPELTAHEKAALAAGKGHGIQTPK